MKSSLSYSLFNDHVESRSPNLIEFSTIYENLQQQQKPLQQPIAPRRSQFIMPNVMVSSCSSTSASSSLNSLSSCFNQLSIDLNSNRFTKQQQQQQQLVDYKKLFVGNLPSNTKLGEILEFFRKYGPINEKLSVVKDQNYAFVHFIHENDAKIALKETNDSLFKNRYIRVQFSTSQAHMKKSRTFDETIGLLKEVTQPQVLKRPITGGNRCIQIQEQQQRYDQIRRLLALSKETFLPVQHNHQSIYHQQQQPFLFTSMIKSNTFASFQNSGTS